MGSGWKGFVCAAASAILLPQLAVADDAAVEQQLRQMQERMGQLEDRLQATSDQLEATQKKSDEQQALIENAGLSDGAGSSGLAAFLETLTIGGHLSTQYNYNFNRPDGFSPLTNANGLRAFDRDADGFSVDQFNVDLSRDISPEQRAGFVASIYMGKTARILNQIIDGCSVSGVGFVTTPVPDGAGGTVDAVTDLGLVEDCNSGDGNNIHLSNAYVQYLIPGTDIKAQMGLWQTFIGAEVIDANGNYNISRSLLFTNAIPFEHLGLLFSKKYESGIDWAVGLVNGWDPSNGADINKSKGTLGRIGYAQDIWAIGLNGYYGMEQVADEENNRTLFDLVFNLNPTDSFSMYFNADYGMEQFDSGGQDRWYGFAVAGRYAITERLGASLRGEWMKDRKSLFFNPEGQQPVLGEGSQIWELTSTLDYALTDHLKARAEFRYDQANLKGTSNNGVFISQQKPGIARPRQANQQTVAGELIYTF